MKLVVLIPAYNHLAEVLTCLNSLAALSTSPQVTGHVQDDASPDVFYPAVIPISVASVSRNDANVGFAANVNRGARFVIQQYQPDILFFVNQDVYGVPEWSHGWDTALLEPFQNPSVGVVAPRLLFPDGHIQSVGGVFDQASQPVHRCLGWSNPHDPECSTPCELEWATGAALAVRASLWQQLNGFDEHYEHGYFEDVDFGLRARAAGSKIAFQPACTLIHSVGSTGGSPYFPQNARRFRAQWVDSGRVKPGRLLPTQRFW